MRAWPTRRTAPTFHWGDAGGLPLAGTHIVVCNWRDSSHPRAGGAEQYCESVATCLARMGANVTYLTSRSEGTPRSEPRPWGRIVRLGGTLGTYPLVLAWLLLHRKSIDGILDSQNGIPYFTPLAVGDRVPVVMLIHHVHQEQFDLYFPKPLNKVGRFLEKQGSRWVYRSRPVCVVSPSTRGAVRRRLKLRGPIFLAPNGLSRAPVAHAATRSVQPTIVTVGRLVPHKRVHLCIEAMPAVLESHPGAVLHVIGDGEARPDLEKLVSDRGLGTAVTFHGRLSDAERDAIVSSAWVTVNASAGEGWGLSVIEAAAMGVPTVAYRVPGLEDSVRDGETGWLIDRGGSLAATLSAAISTLADTEVAAGWAERCQRWASTFTWEAAAERISNVMMSEAERIERRYDERRGHSDSSTIVALPQGTSLRLSLQRLRDTDQVRIDVEGQRIELLLSGADEIDTTGALTRIGIDPDRTYWSRLARYRDLLGWQSKAQYLKSAEPEASGEPAPDEGDPSEYLILDLAAMDDGPASPADQSGHGET